MSSITPPAPGLSPGVHPPEPDMAPLELTGGIGRMLGSRSSRDELIERLIELVSWPESRIAPYERQLAGDILVGFLRNCGLDMRRKCAEGLVRVQNAPNALLRYLACDEISVARPLLQECRSFDDSDLNATIRAGVSAHWLEIARRRQIGPTVTEVLMQTGDPAVMEAALRNQTAVFSSLGLDLCVARARRSASLPPLIVKRLELRPNQALMLFWWSSFEERVQILRRFSIDRAVLLHELADAFALAAAEGWVDAEVRKALHIVERRQRNRAATARSPFGSLEDAISEAQRGLEPELLNELAHLSGIRPKTLEQILADPGGEPLGVLAKSVGLRRNYLIALWRAVGRPVGDADSQDNPLGRTVLVFEMLSTAKAQTVLRYWNWSFTADALNLENVEEIGGASMSQSRRNAALLFGRNR